jgi:hypothetical protein
MVSNGYLRFFVGGFLALVWLLSFQVGPIVATHSGCDVQVSPRTGPAGSQFEFSGSRFQPTQLRLVPKTGTPVAHDIDVDSAGPWQYKVDSLTGDQGMWVAVFTDPQTSCTAKAVFWVTATTGASTESAMASSNANSSSVSPTAAAGPKLPVVNLWLVVTLIGLVGGTAVGLRAFARNQA